MLVPFPAPSETHGHSAFPWLFLVGAGLFALGSYWDVWYRDLIAAAGIVIGVWALCWAIGPHVNHKPARR